MKNCILFLLVSFVACSPKLTPVQTAAPITLDGKLYAAAYHQKSAEYRALCFQAFNFARYRVDTYQPQSIKPKAIITDIDETILDNSPYEVACHAAGKGFDNKTWHDWTAKAIADTIPGSASFLKYAVSKGIEIFYITNRDDQERISTIKNLQRFGLPYADEAHLLTKQTTSSKEERRKKIMASYEVVLLLGDNLADFSSLFDKKTSTERLSNTNYSMNEFGKRFIIIPNAIYGDWESVIYNYNNRLTLSQKDSVIKTIMYKQVK